MPVPLGEPRSWTSGDGQPPHNQGEAGGLRFGAHQHPPGMRAWCLAPGCELNLGLTSRLVGTQGCQWDVTDSEGTEMNLLVSLAFQATVWCGVCQHPHPNFPVEAVHSAREKGASSQSPECLSETSPEGREMLPPRGLVLGLPRRCHLRRGRAESLTRPEQRRPDLPAGLTVERNAHGPVRAGETAPLNRATYLQGRNLIRGWTLCASLDHVT